MRRLVGFLIILTIGGCSRSRAQKEHDRDSAAFKAGAAAHEIAKQAAKTAAEAERQLRESQRQLQDSARKVKEGWKQKEREDQEKASPRQ
jgi:hypothetical protein